MKSHHGDAHIFVTGLLSTATEQTGRGAGSAKVKEGTASHEGGWFGGYERGAIIKLYADRNRLADSNLA
jgi:hypothetical protein